MDFKGIQSLGEQTSRVLEIEDQLSILQAYAKKTIDEDDQVLNLTIVQTSEEGLKNDQEREKHSAEFESFLMKRIFRIPEEAIIHKTTYKRGRSDLHILLKSNYQLKIYDALIEALKEEQQDLYLSILAKNGKV